ncbi:hypothetical protein ABZZ74_50715 [Streptomyces sp. NPDC006476]|uniref:hypothetical protein n=1 Tax=Streptomyces sp. NPDC006476 TaxID=3157175 RepID=UPI0033A51294
MHEQQWITARRSELDALAKELAKQLQEVQAERDELAIAERVLNRLAEQARDDAGAIAPVSAKVAGRAVLLIPHRSDAADEGALPGAYRKLLAIVREADGPVQVRAVGERLGLDASVRGRLEPLRAKMTKPAGGSRRSGEAGTGSSSASAWLRGSGGRGRQRRSRPGAA